MKLPLYGVGLLLILKAHLGAAEKREVPIHLTTSVIIPCHVKHFPMLKELLNEYANNQTVVPNEIVVSLAPIGSLSKEGRAYLNDMQQAHWPFSLKILAHFDVLTAGANRNKACEVAMGDILLCQDADDIPHPQRVQVIKWFFENYDIDHLMHGFVESNDKKALSDTIHLGKINWETLPEYCLIHTIANGPIAITRAVFEQVQWIEENIHGEDVLFNQKVYEYFPKTIVIYDSLYLYRRGVTCLAY